MKILLISIGTRGDMEPFLAIGQLLKERGHRVICLFPEQFRELAIESGFEFASLGPEFMEMLESDLGKFALGGGGSQLKKIMAFVKLAKYQTRINRLMVRKQYETVKELNPDRIVHNGKALYPVIWEITNPGQTTFISPVPYLHYVKGHTHTAFHSNYGEFLNKLTYTLANWGTLKAIMAQLKWLEIPGIRKEQVKKAFKEHRIVYTVSPQLFSRPPYWQENMQVLGYHERDKTTQWEAPEALLRFLKIDSKILFVTFGSMTNPAPEEKTRIILNILERHKIPAIINTSSGGLKEPGTYNRELFYFTSGIPYEWIFPKVYGVIHHGGSGTTHMAVKYGCASLIIPHIIDQFVWNEILNEKGVGPKGIKIGRITEKNLEPLILDLVYCIHYREKAQKLALQMAQEKYLEEELCRSILN